jgi:hypothetical protein
MNAHHPSDPRAYTSGRIHRRIVVTGVAAVSVLFPAACGGGSTPDAGPGTTVVSQPDVTSGVAGTSAFADPCTLLTQDEVDTAAGQPLQAGKQVETLDDCQWTNVDFTASVDVTVSDWTAIKNAATANDTKSPAVVTGVGDEALGDANLLSVRKGDMGFLLIFNYPDMSAAPDQGMAQAKVLAAAVLSRL